ncbi:MAG: hypothetical protein HYV26_02305 [Candidatus Hydrogenedentes bacterium]|nr:hypothetical protein [Candidatus Hydrogenedentota bacterium]
MNAKHLHHLTQTPCVAQSGLQIKLTGTTAIIERLLLAQQQNNWKLYDTGGTGGGGEGEGEGEVL